MPTPVGNLEDMTFRAIKVLKEADLILAEDTRTSSVLLAHYEIHGRLLSHHKFNEHQTSEMIRDRILAGENVALISDAGTPGISDPGFLLSRSCAGEGLKSSLCPAPQPASRPSSLRDSPATVSASRGSFRRKRAARQDLTTSHTKREL